MKNVTALLTISTVEYIKFSTTNAKHVKTDQIHESKLGKM